MPIVLNGTTGEVFPSWTTAGRPAAPVAGQTGYNSTLGIVETYNGSSWVPTGGIAGLGPAFDAYKNATQTLGANSWTKLTFTVENFDTNSNYDTSTSRFTPTVAGYYQISAATGYTASATVGVSIYKNGAIAKYGTNGTGFMCVVSALIYLNGSTDYIEAWGINVAGGTIAANNENAYFSAFLARSA
jgi:hypothetical protein